MSGTVEEIHISKERRKSLQKVQYAELEAGKGIVGDRYHVEATEKLAAGETVRENHLSLIAKEELNTFLARNKAELQYGDFRRNIITSGIDLNAMVGKKFTLGQAVCQGIEFCEPCAYLAATVHRAVLPELKEKAGLRAIILKDGTLEVGSKIAPLEE